MNDPIKPVDDVLLKAARETYHMRQVVVHWTTTLADKSEVKIEFLGKHHAQRSEAAYKALCEIVKQQRRDESGE